MKYSSLTLAAVLWLSSCSGPEQTAGSASVTTNGTVAGIVRDSTGAVLPYALAYLQASTTLGDAPLLIDTADAEGRYHFSAVPAGEYRLLVYSPDSMRAFSVESVVVDSATELQLPSIAPISMGTMRISAKHCPVNEGEVYMLPGTQNQRQVTAQEAKDGVLLWGPLVPGVYAQLLRHIPAQGISFPQLARPLVLSSDTLDLNCDYESFVAQPQGFVTVNREDLAWGGALGDTVRVASVADLRNALIGDKPRVVLVTQSLQGLGDTLRIGSHKTLLGWGPEVRLDSLGFVLKEAQNVVVRNLVFRSSTDDALNISNSRWIWIDHNRFETCADGQVDIKRGSEYITLSWNHFRAQKATALVGHSDQNGLQDSTHLLVSFHHNWFERIDGAAPRVRYGTVHIANNFYDSLRNYAIASTQWAKVVVENNYFRKVRSPVLLQHTSPYEGEAVVQGNLLEMSGFPLTKGASFSPSTYYSWEAEPVEDVRTRVQWGAGVGKLAHLSGL